MSDGTIYGSIEKAMVALDTTRYKLTRVGVWKNGALYIPDNAPLSRYASVKCYLPDGRVFASLKLASEALDIRNPYSLRKHIVRHTGDAAWLGTLPKPKPTRRGEGWRRNR